MDCFVVGRLHGSTGPVWPITAIDTYSSFAWADLVVHERFTRRKRGVTTTAAA
jgi:hypothetical protein